MKRERERERERERKRERTKTDFPDNIIIIIQTQIYLEVLINIHWNVGLDACAFQRIF